MARTLRAVTLLALVALLFGPGCASWRAHRPADASVPPSTDSGGLFQDVLQGLSNASMNNWNFNSDRW